MAEHVSDINENERDQVYQSYEDGYIVRAMNPEDAHIVQKWYTGMGMISRHDLDVCLAVFPPGPGFYIGEYEGEVVASAIRIPWADNVYYGSYYYVEGKYRGKGFGTRLRDEVAFGHVGKNILCVDAVKGKVAENNRTKFSYVDGEWDTGRWQGVAKKSHAEHISAKIVPVDQISFDKLVDYDNKCFISRDNPVRRKFLESMAHVPGGATYVAVGNDGDITGIAFMRPCIQDNSNILGPLYADDANIAESLLATVCQGVAGTNVSINICHRNKAALAMVEKFGFECIFTALRMHVNGNPNEYKDTVFGLTSIDVCGF